MRPPDPADLVASEPMPPGSYTITPEAHRRFVEHTFGGDVFATAVGGPAHPSFAHLMTHCGQGWTFDEFRDRVGASPDVGVVFGTGTWDFVEPLAIGRPHAVHARISAVARRAGRRVGVFDAITLAQEASAGGAVVLRATETLVVPRPGLDPPRGPRVVGEPPPRPPEPPDLDGGEPFRQLVGPVGIDRIRVLMDVMDDTNQVHVDLDLARRTGYRGRVNQGPANLAYLLAAVARWRGGLDDLRRVSFEFHDTVTEDDLLQVVAPASITTDPVAVIRLDVRGVGCAVVAELDFRG